ncbi:hypothetical protein [Enterobacter phage N5822]|nr:hypothetical protein [Enterobacter phage N5822]
MCGFFIGATIRNYHKGGLSMATGKEEFENCLQSLYPARS